MSGAKARVGCLLIENTGGWRGGMGARCRRHVLELCQVHRNSIDQVGNA